MGRTQAIVRLNQSMKVEGENNLIWRRSKRALDVVRQQRSDQTAPIHHPNTLVS